MGSDRGYTSRAKSSGFTLIEILLAITIFSMVVAVMFSAFRVGIGSWEKGERGIEFYQKMRAVSALLHREISAAYPYLLTPGELDTHVKFFAFFGRGESLKFVSYSNLHRKASGLSLLELWVNESKGLMLGEAPALSSNLSDLDATPVRHDDNSMVLSPAVRKIEFRYFDRKKGEEDGEWLEQ
ncbi:MAG: prepilin-type N-terminal cleavage/methylation domain-containing protein [Pseudomonadota bacterium]